MRTQGSQSLGLVAMLLIVGCEAVPPDIIENERLDVWCAESSLCSWENTGRIERVGTWWSSDYGLSLVDDPTTVSQRSFQGEAYGCLVVRAMADIALDVQVTFEVDLQDDGSVEGSFPIVAQDFARVEQSIRLPAEGWIDYARFGLVKRGVGRAVLADVFVDRVSPSPGACTTEPLMPEWDDPPPPDAGVVPDGGGF